jgi:hypothetical protein
MFSIKTNREGNIMCSAVHEWLHRPWPGAAYIPGDLSAYIADEAAPHYEFPTARARPGRLGASMASGAFPTVNRFYMALLHGRAGRLTAENGGFRPGQWWFFVIPSQFYLVWIFENCLWSVVFPSMLAEMYGDADKMFVAAVTGTISRGPYRVIHAPPCIFS